MRRLVELRLPTLFVGNLAVQMAEVDLDMYGERGILHGLESTLWILTFSHGSAIATRESFGRYFDYDYFMSWVMDRHDDPYTPVLCRQSNVYDILLDAIFAVYCQAIAEWYPYLLHFPWEGDMHVTDVELRSGNRECRVTFDVFQQG
jgi:hypothetical protein